jgi:very-short-patch-repair endonuclease
VTDPLWIMDFGGAVDEARAPSAGQGTVDGVDIGRRDPWRHDLATVASLVESGHVYRTVRRRIRVTRWQEPLKGVVCRTSGSMTAYQWQVAATLYAGPRSALSHASAAEAWGIVSPHNRVVVTVPNGQHPPSTPEVWVRQSSRPFRMHLLRGLPVTPPARSVLDAALDLRRLGDVETLLGRALQIRRVTLDELVAELQNGPSAGSLLARRAMAGLAAGSRAASESELWRLLRAARIPLPELNAAVDTEAGTKYIDGLWRHLARGVEVDGQAFHLGPQEWQADLRRQNAIQSTGIVLLRIAAARLWAEPDAVVAEIRTFLASSAA